MIGGCCVDTLAYGGHSNDYPLIRTTGALYQCSLSQLVVLVQAANTDGGKLRRAPVLGYRSGRLHINDSNAQSCVACRL